MDACELLCSVNKLKVKEITLEKNELDFIQALENKYGHSFQPIYEHMKKSRDLISQKIQNDVSENFEYLNYIKNDLDASLINCDLQKLRQKMLNMESHTSDVKFRVEKALEDLCKEELSLSICVSNIEMKVSEQIKSVKSEENTIINHSKIQKEHQLLKEVKDFLTFLDNNGGHEGGWTHSDHFLFVRLYRHFKRKVHLTQALVRMFPDKTENEINKHIEWFNSYTELKKGQKTAIQKWRDEKKQNGSKEKIPPQEIQHSPNHKPVVVNTENDEFVKQKIQNWKLEQQQKQKQETKSKMEEMMKAKEIEQIKQQKQAETKAEVEKWRKSKDERMKAEKLSKEIVLLQDKERKMLMANKLIRDFQNQDNIIISKRLNQLKINVDPPTVKSPRYRKKTLRNPDRLLKCTKTWEAKKIVMEENLKKFDAQVGLMKIPTLAKPTWRQHVQDN